MKFFLNSHNQLRNVWWIAIFFLVLASLTFPLILLSHYFLSGAGITHISVDTSITAICL